MAAGIGMMVVAGRSFPVTSLALRGGQLVVTAEGPGPCPAFRDEPVTVFGEDGVGMVQGGHISTEAARPQDTVRLRVELRFTRLTDEGKRTGDNCPTAGS
jgi:hypothetical protein